jgi:hypothetical protein
MARTDRYVIGPLCLTERHVIGQLRISYHISIPFKLRWPYPTLLHLFTRLLLFLSQQSQRLKRASTSRRHDDDSTARESTQRGSQVVAQAATEDFQRLRSLPITEVQVRWRDSR